MATEALEIRMARLEGGYGQINERLGSLEQRFGGVEHRIAGLEQRVASESAAIRGEITSLRADVVTRSDLETLRLEMRGADSELRRQITGQFYWLLTLVIGSILLPLARDLVP
jgi:hypothetical protein